MEPLSALSTVTAIMQFLDFSNKVISNTAKIYKSTSGAPEAETDIRTLTDSLVNLNGELRKSISRPALTPFSSHDGEITKLAERCNELCERLVSVLVSLRSQSKHRVWASFQQALKTIWSQDEVDSLRESIKSYREQIDSYLLVSLRETVMIMLDSHTREDITTQKTQKTLEETRNACYTILEGVSDSKRRNALILNALKPQYTHIPSGSCEAAPTAQMYRVMQPADVDRTNQRILRLLRFRGMESRFEQIPQAYAKTFEWVYGPSTSSSPAKSTDADGSNTEKWANFTKWLGGDESLYWITGKAGAGKSTLMRFLYRDERTREGLSSWSCDRPLTMPYFFFWNSGERIQMSYEGLLRTLAYQVLQQMPHLIPIVFPHRVEATILLGVDESEPWTCEELFRGFRILLRSATETNSLILFIDGMDEFEGEASTLIDFVTGLLECGPYIKVCASSRPWQVFKDSFGHHPHLKVEDLTFGDINCYVTSKLGGHLGFQAYQRLDQEFSTQLIENVCLKSSGVFLWVSLVTRSLLEGLSEGENLSSLQKRLDDLPPELEDLFWKILRSLNKVHFRKISQLLDILSASIRQLSLLDLYYTDEENPEYAIKAPCRFLTVEQADSQVDIMPRRVNAYCKGLLEETSEDNSQYPKLTYAHRSVKDFLEKEEVKVELNAATGKDFNPNLRLCNAYIMGLSCQGVPTFITAEILAQTGNICV